ncbi:conjugal transfer protein TraQ [Chryseobacterium pennae]|uniref:Conjugal transfer protein TraQ n=1 Tax=Chryseobacterium pennae TaxID=2258962 RepID=A0A3D9C9Y5_9FLAO|nr:conjugal transfer protein TraQ [Chryseobacterium pennae]
MKNIVHISQMSFGTIVLGLMAIVGILFLSGCEKESLDIQENFPFEVKVMPVPKDIAIGETAEIRIAIISNGDYAENTYYLRYFQNDGQGILRYFDHKPYLPNDLYPLAQKEFRLYYTSESFVAQNFDVWIADSFGNEKQLSFQFNNKKLGPIIIGPVR